MQPAEQTRRKVDIRHRMRYLPPKPGYTAQFVLIRWDESLDAWLFIAQYQARDVRRALDKVMRNNALVAAGQSK